MKNKDGVSLITLVITIIVVIILSVIALGSGALDLGGRAQFSGFASEMSTLRDRIQAEHLLLKGQLQTQMTFPKDEQIYNYIARGLSRAGKTYEDSYDTWLTEIQATSIPCTIINQEFAKKYWNLKNRYEETYLDKKQLLSYFVTPKGNVFCWPPYRSNDKSYVNGETTVKTLTGEELDGVDATNGAINPTVKITFLNGEEVIVANSAPSNYNISKGSEPIDKTKPSIWYSEETISDNARVKKYGVAAGYTFEGYDRAQ